MRRGDKSASILKYSEGSKHSQVEPRMEGLTYHQVEPGMEESHAFADILMHSCNMGSSSLHKIAIRYNHMPNVTNRLKTGIPIWEVHSGRLTNALWSKDTPLASAYLEFWPSIQQ